MGYPPDGRAKGRALLAVAQRHLTDAGVGGVVLKQQHGALADAIVELEPATAVVVHGKRGEHADFAKLHLGSNLERVIRSSVQPGLVASRAFKPIQRFLIAFDGGPSSKKAVAYAATQPLLKGLSCHLLSVATGRSELPAEQVAARDQLMRAGYTITAETLGGSRDEVIADAVKRQGIDLLVMGAYGYSRIRQFIVGSTTTTMIRTVHVPVLMFR